MNLPNKLTLLRVILIPFFLLFMYIDVPFHYGIALVIFSAASITDAFDGKIARKNNLITDFGKFLDPLADTILVISALVCFVSLNLLLQVLLNCSENNIQQDKTECKCNFIHFINKNGIKYE